MGVLIFGSLNIDIVTYLKRMPLPGETVLGDRFETFPGGKGLNQAVAAARAGGQVTMVGVLGSDANSEELKRVMDVEKINNEHVRRIEGACGTAVIEVDQEGQNRIIVISAANSDLKSSDISDSLLKSITNKKILLSQLESPIGLAILLISHNFDQVLRLSDQIWVMRQGDVMAGLRAKDTSGDELVALITGAKAGRG